MHHISSRANQNERLPLFKSHHCVSNKTWSETGLAAIGVINMCVKQANYPGQASLDTQGQPLMHSACLKEECQENLNTVCGYITY